MISGFPFIFKLAAGRICQLGDFTPEQWVWQTETHESKLAHCLFFMVLTMVFRVLNVEENHENNNIL